MKAKIFVLFFILTCHVFGQSAEIQRSFKLPFETVIGSIDRQGHLYFASIDGVIEKYDQSGKLLYHFSPQKKATPSLLEAWQGLRVFAYYQAFQEYLFLNRFLTYSERYNLDQLKLGQFNGVFTLSADNNFWIFNSNTLTLSKVDIQNGEILFENNLSLTLNTKSIQPTFIREYQNLVFISDRQQGVLVFDNLGNYIELIDIKGLDYFSFQSNDLVAISDNTIVHQDIYSKRKREISTANLSYQIVFMENNQLIAISGNQVDILSIN